MKTPIISALCLAAVTASAQVAQPPAGKPDSTKAATKAATPAATKQAGKAPAAPAAPAAQAPTPRVPVIMREVFGYEQETRRDPFVSLLSTAELRPTVADLKLTGVLYDETGSRSIATMRDLTTSEMYRVTTGVTLGRMKVVLIKRNAVIFSIEEFGLNRQDSLVLGDTTKARAK